MIIDCHGHYTTAPAELQAFRDAQIAALEGAGPDAEGARSKISDDQIRESLEKAQLKLQRERGTDLTIFSPRASAMAHHIGDEATSLRVDARLQRPDPPRVRALSRQLRRRLPAAAVAGRAAGEHASRSWSAASRSWASSAAT